MMKSMMSGAFAGIFFVACGGGGENKPSDHPAPPVRTEPGMTEPNVPPEKPGAPVKAPPVDAHAVTFSAPSIHFASDATSMLIKLAGVSNLELSGTRNKVWISEGQAMNRIVVNGASNTIVIMRGASVDAFTVGAGNTVYLPFGSTITVGGSGATVKYYTD